MASNNDGLICAAVSWGIALVAGTVLAAVLMILGTWTLLQAMFVGIILFVALGALLSLTMCGPQRPPVQTRPAAPKQPAKIPSDAAAAPAPAGAAAPAATAAPAPEPTAAAEPTPAPEPSPTPAPEPASEDAGPGKRPEALSAPREGGADDLKKIKGVGPKLEQLCHRLGFFHYDQIANWTAEEVAWVDQNLEGFKGRVTRDDWVAQARLLAAGGETEFSKRVDKGDVY
jgi:predicted flap endonuclease-1-like 5' DNA nuclease